MGLTSFDLQRLADEWENDEMAPYIRACTGITRYI